MGDEAETPGSLCSKCRNFRDCFSSRISNLDHLIKTLAPKQVNQIRGALQDGYLFFDYGEMSLDVAINLNHRYPLQHRIENRELPRKVVDAIRLSLRIHQAEESAAFQTVALFGIMVSILRLVEETTSHVVEHRQQLGQKDQHNPEDSQEWENRIVSTGDQLFNERSIDDGTFSGPAHILGVTPRQICEKIAPSQGSLRVIHCENVLRADLKVSFREKQAQMRRTLNELSARSLARFVPQAHRRGRGNIDLQKEELIEFLVRPRITFHGTRKEIVSSIVRYGFLKPGDKHPGSGEEIGVRCGSTYGRGIYSSPDASFAIGYSEFDAQPTKASDIPGLKVIVCATLMGRAAGMYGGDDWRLQSLPYDGADSHVGNEELEFIVFDKAQILPCYVVHLDWGSRPLRTLEEVRSRAWRQQRAPKPAMSILSSGERQRLKQEQLAQARKFFAYGFGPVSGDRLVVEDVADVDDDEEEYGDYQANRVDPDYEAKVMWDWEPRTKTGKRVIDQYASERNEC